MNCRDCGHSTNYHWFSIDELKLKECRYRIEDGTDKGTIACGCLGWK